MTSQKPSSSQDRLNSYADLLRLDQAKYDELLRLRDKTTDQADDSKTRGSKRLRLVGPLWIGAEFRSPNGDISSFRVYPIDLSSGGVAIFVGLFIHKDTPVGLKIRTVAGDWVSVQGRCVRCTFLSGRVHEVGVKFDEVFDMSLVQAVDPKGASHTPSDSPPPGSSQIAISNQDLAQQSQALAAASIELKTIAKELLDVIEKANDRLQKVTETANAITAHQQAIAASSNASQSR